MWLDEVSPARTTLFTRSSFSRIFRFFTNPKSKSELHKPTSVVWRILA
jgi:hypothetical protein